MMHLFLFCSRELPSCDSLLLLALDHLPALELGNRPVLLDPHEVSHPVLIGFVVGVILLRSPHRLLEHRMGEAALDPDNDGLVLLVAHHGPLKRPLRHPAPPLSPRTSLARAFAAQSS